MKAIENKLNSISTSGIIEIVEGLIDKTCKESDLVLECALGVLRKRMDDEKFVALCGQIEEMI